jgi:hypothetical protein
MWPTRERGSSDDYFAKTYEKWRHDVEKARRTGAARASDDYFERTYRDWRESIDQGKRRGRRRPRPKDELPHAPPPLSLLLKRRYGERGWLLTVDACVALTIVAAGIVAGIRAGSLRTFGEVPRSMSEAQGLKGKNGVGEAMIREKQELLRERLERLPNVKDMKPW